MTTKYSRIIAKYIDNDYDLTTDDLILEKRIDRFNTTRDNVLLQEIIVYLRSNKKSDFALEMADELETLVKTEDAVQAPESLISAPVVNQAEDVEAPESSKDEVYFIAPGTKVAVHELAATFPMIPDHELATLVESIKLNGQQNPIIMDGDLLLDGRNRLKACQTLGISAKAVQWHGERTAEDLILALNLHRRHLTASQLAAVAVKLLPSIEKQSEARKKAGKSTTGENVPQGKSTEIAGAQVGVSGKYITKAKKIAQVSEEIFQGLLSGRLTLTEACKATKVPNASSSEQSVKRITLLEAITNIIVLVNDDDEHNDKLKEIAAEAPPVVSKAIKSFFEGEDLTGEDNDDAAVQDAVEQPNMF